MKESLKKFMEVVSSNSSSVTKLQEINEKYTEAESNKSEIIKFADTLGIKLTDADFVNDEESEISDDELEAVSGGTSIHYKCPNSATTGIMASDCFCAVGGGGTGDEYQKTCACIIAGAGEFTGAGLEKVKSGEYKNAGSSGAPVAVWCALSGRAF